MQTHNPTTLVATAAAVEADAEAVTKTGDKSPSTILGWVWVNSSSDTDDASEHFESSIHESPSGSDVRSATITVGSRQQLELRDGISSTDTNKIPSYSDVDSATRDGKIPSDSDVDSATITRGDGSYVFEACMISVSFLLVLSSPLLLRRLYSEPLAHMWSIAAFISAYIIFLIFIFSPKMGLSTVFFDMPCPVLLSIAAEKLVGPIAGFLVMHTATGWVAGVLGYAYAEHLQHIGRETTAKHMSSPTFFLTEENERFFKADRGAIALGFGLVSLILATVGAVPLWVLPMEGFPISVVFLTFMEGTAIFSWVLSVARFVLYDALLSVDQLGDIVLCYICPCVVTGYFVLLLSFL